MPGSVGQFFLRNWLLKLAAVFFAVMLYVAVAAQQPLTETFALRLSVAPPPGRALRQAPPSIAVTVQGKGSERSEEHTSELQSLAYLVCRLLLEKKKQSDMAPETPPCTGDTSTSTSVPG